MSETTDQEAAFEEFLACVECSGTHVEKDVDRYRCKDCGAEFEIVAGVASFFRKSSSITDEDSDRMEFWNQGWNETGSPFRTVEREDPHELRQTFQSALEAQQYPAVTWLSEQNVRDRLFLNIGCGGGYEGSLFAGYGARYIGVDFSINAAASTRRLIHAGGYSGTCYQCEAERLPIRDSVIEIVYTNGVLHHTPNTPETLKEIHRVMAPGSRAVIALYATHSAAFYWYRFRAILAGNFTRRSVEAWVDGNTEGEWQTEDRNNQHTRTYSRSKFKSLIEDGGFEVTRIEQSQLQLRDIPVIGRILRMFLPESILLERIGPFGMMLIADCKPSK